MIHSFQTEIAEECGVEAAIIFANIQHWIKHNQANGTNLRDGEVWTFNSRAAWCEQFPYLGEKQIRNAVERLVESGLVVRGNFSGGSSNRTYWYRLGERAKDFGPNAETIGRKGQTIKDIKPNTKLKDIPPLVPEGFAEFWAEYPNKQGKVKAETMWRRLKGSDRKAVMASLPAWKASRQWTEKGGQFIPHASTFLNQRRWEEVPNVSSVAPHSHEPITDTEIRL